MRAWLLWIPALGVVLAAGCGGTAGGGRTNDPFPPSVYPKPASSPNWGSPAGCTSLKNVAPIDPRQARHHSLRVLSRWGQVSERRDLELSDRAEWPIVREVWKHRSSHRHARRVRARDVVQGPGRRSPYAGLVRHNCGAQILRRSWWVAMCPGRYPLKARCTLGTAPALTGHVMLVDRRHHWLVWFSYP